MSDLRPDLIKRARQMAINNSQKTHIWSNMTDEEMLRSLDFLKTDLKTGQEDLTLGAILLFGKDSTIISALLQHRTDAIYRVKNCLHLLDTYDKIMKNIIVDKSKKINDNIARNNKNGSNEKMKKTKKMIRNFILFILLIILTFYIILKDQDITEILNVVKKVKVNYILIAMVGMCIYVICEAINIGRTLKVLNEKSTFIKNVKYALIGFFFSGITPAASGGQPMQIYYMYKEKISVANSTLALLINLSSMQIVTISISLISLIFNYQYLNKALVACFILGITLNASALTLLLIAIFSKKILKKLINLIVKIMKKIKIKNIEDKQMKLEAEVNKYQNSSDYIKNNKFVMLKIILTTYIQFIAFYSVSYWTYCSFGLKEYNFIKIVSIQAILYATVSGIPSPGAVGITEGGFIEIFKKIIPNNIINSAMLLNRGISFYLLIIISGIVTVINMLKKKKMLKNEEL